MRKLQERRAIWEADFQGEYGIYFAMDKNSNVLRISHEAIGVTKNYCPEVVFVKVFPCKRVHLSYLETALLQKYEPKYNDTHESKLPREELTGYDLRIPTVSRYVKKELAKEYYDPKGMPKPNWYAEAKAKGRTHSKNGKAYYRKRLEDMSADELKEYIAKLERGN